MIRTNKYPVPNLIFPQHVLVSTFDKTNLEILVDTVLTANPDATFYSTGGTGERLREALGTRKSKNYVAVETFTGCPEMEGGLVKTLHPKIHAGLLAERNNPDHERYLAIEMARFGQGPGIYFDIFAGNLYPFNEVVIQDGGSAEVARCYIDIGGPCMTMAAAKNWHSVTVLSDPFMYEQLGDVLQLHGNKIPVAIRFSYAVKAMSVIENFRRDNGTHFRKLNFEQDVLPTLNLQR